MKEKINFTEGMIVDQKSKRIYIVKLTNGSTKKVRLSLKQIRNYSPLYIGAKIFVELSSFEKEECRLLTSTDFKTNGWSGWDSDFEPRSL